MMLCTQRNEAITSLIKLQSYGVTDEVFNIREFLNRARLENAVRISRGHQAPTGDLYFTEFCSHQVKIHTLNFAIKGHYKAAVAYKGSLGFTQLSCIIILMRVFRSIIIINTGK
jgi:hypothetical protein